MDSNDKYSLYGYIEFVPIIAGFVTPVFVRNEELYVEISFNNKIEYFEIIPAYYGASIVNERRLIKLDIEQGSECQYAFKWDEKVLYGSSIELVKELKKVATEETMDFNTLISIQNFIEKYEGDSPKVNRKIVDINLDTASINLIDKMHSGTEEIALKFGKRLAFQSQQFSNEADIIDGLKSPGTQRKSSENLLFSTFIYFVKQGIRKYGLAEEQAFDAYSDTILSIIHNVNTGKFHITMPLKSYAYKIFNNKCIDIVRKNSINKKRVHFTTPLDSVVTQLPDETSNIIQKLITKNELSTITKKLMEIGEKCRELLLLSNDGYTAKEIAVIMGFKTPLIVNTQRLRCIRKLTELIQNENKE